MKIELVHQQQEGNIYLQLSHLLEKSLYVYDVYSLSSHVGKYILLKRSDVLQAAVPLLA